MGNIRLDDYYDVSFQLPYGGHMVGRWYGNRKERPILALHGWQDNLGTFDTLIPLLPDYLGVLCIDMVGHGLSCSVPPGMLYSADDWILLIGRIMKAYKWDKVSLMGHSLGAVFNFIFTSLAPHLVDMVISLDMCIPPFDEPETLEQRREYMEKLLIEDDRVLLQASREPPSYTMEQLRDVLCRGTMQSVPVEFAQYLLNRSVAKSQLYPDRYYFSKDGRAKYYSLFPFCAEKAVAMASRIRNKPYLIIKGTGSPFIDSRCDEVLAIFNEQNPDFELHEVDGLHHVHLVSAPECAKHIVPFLRKHRPPPQEGKHKL